MNSENKYNCDYAVPKKPEGSYKTARLLVRISYFLVPIIIIAALFPFLKYAVFVLVPFFLFISRPIIGGTWRYVNYDHRYEIISGSLRFTRYYGRKFRVDKNDAHADEKVAEKVILEHRIKDFETFAPYNDPQYRAEFEKMGIKSVINHTSSPTNPNIYYGIYNNDAGEKCAILFDMIDKSLGILAYYNKNTVVTELHFAGEDLGK